MDWIGVCGYLWVRVLNRESNVNANRAPIFSSTSSDIEDQSHFLIVLILQYMPSKTDYKLEFFNQLPVKIL